jgi:hypothetical protein
MLLRIPAKVPKLVSHSNVQSLLSLNCS